jgi:two-component system response regulator HupR/HoxA
VAAASELPPTKPCLLVVDDEQLNRDLLRRLLKREYDIFEAEDAPGAVAILEEHQDIVLVLCDQLMPGRCGTDLAEEVQRRWPAMRFVLLTGYDEDPAVRGALLRGLVREVVAKPWRSDLLRTRIAEIVRE